jgi:hypothetical protein
MHLIDYIEKCQKMGKLWFTKSAAIDELGCTAGALQQSVYDLVCKKRLATIRGDFILIIPFEYESWGIVPADWFIDPLMQHLKLPYYISALSAGEYHGASHQKPMQFQVVTNKYLRDIKYGRIHIRFLQNNRAIQMPTQRIQVQTGYAVLATPETMAFDLCKFYVASGYWSNIATVLLELLEVVDPKKLCEIAASKIYNTSVLQRLGFMLSHPDVKGSAVADTLYASVNPKSFRWVPLTPRQKYIEDLGLWEKNDKWKILINEDIESDI